MDFCVRAFTSQYYLDQGGSLLSVMKEAHKFSEIKMNL